MNLQNTLEKMQTSCSQWHTLYTMPNCERKVEGALRKIGIESFLPMHEVIRHWSDRKKRMRVPLFPNYIFTRVSNIDRFKVLGQHGVIRFVSTGKNPDVILEHEIEFIRKALVNNPLVHHLSFKRGETVRVIKGPFAGSEGTLEELKGHSRLVISLPSVSSALSIQIDSNDIERVCQRKIS